MSLCRVHSSWPPYINPIRWVFNYNQRRHVNIASLDSVTSCPCTHIGISSSDYVKMTWAMRTGKKLKVRLSVETKKKASRVLGKRGRGHVQF